jgi:hypothetical protein
MYNVCPKRRLPKTTQPAPFEHTWANIVSGLTTSEDVPCISDLIRMETDTGSQARGEKAPSVKGENQREPKPVQRVGQQTTSDEETSHISVNSKQTCSTPVPLTWADEVPETEQSLPARAKPTEESPEVVNEWPSLRQPIEDYQDSRTPQTSQNPSVIDTDENQGKTDISTDSCTEHTPVDKFTTGTTRKKKLQVDKNSDNTQDRKRNRTRTPTSTKGKH